MAWVLPERPIILITGASSGIGRAIAVAFAARGASLVLVSRDGLKLQQAAGECRTLGAKVLVQAMDVSDAAAVEQLRLNALAEFGLVDVWVNCAAVLVFGRFEEIPPEHFQRVIETNLIGHVNCCRAALKQFHSQGHRGVLIDTSSMLGVLGEPYVSAYVASKFAIRGFDSCVRQEMRDFQDISVCTMLPAAVDTPIYQKAGNYFGRKPRSIFPLYSPERVARAVVGLAKRPRREARIGFFAHLLWFAVRLAPMLLERTVARIAPGLQFQDIDASVSAGNLLQSTGPHTTNGGWKNYWKRRLLLPLGR